MSASAKSINYKAVGLALSQMRKQLGLSRIAVCRPLQTNIKYIEAMELGNVGGDGEPSEALVKCYAKKLNYENISAAASYGEILLHLKSQWNADLESKKNRIGKSITVVRSSKYQFRNLSDITGISISGLNNLETGKRGIRFERLLEVLKALGYEISNHTLDDLCLDAEKLMASQNMLPPEEQKKWSDLRIKLPGTRVRR